MKTVSAKIESSTPVSLRKAAYILSRFISDDTGASQAINAYLSRTNAALDDLVRLHSKYERRRHKNDVPTRSVEVSQEPSRSSSKSERKEEKMKDEVVNSGGEAKDGVNLGEKKKKKKKKKEKNADFEDVGDTDNKGKIADQDSEINLVEEPERKKKKKREENGVVVELRQEGSNVEVKEEEVDHIENGKEKKKRKNRDYEEESGVRLEERTNKKKKTL